MINKKLLLIVMIPFILLCLLIVRAEYHLNMGTEWDIAVRGYDPRDLLRGHYLRFRLDYNYIDNKENNCSGDDCCLCLNKAEHQAPKVHKTDCATAKTQCDAFILSELQHSLNRFYIPETKAQLAETLLQKAREHDTAYLRLSINAKGEPRIVDMLINREPMGKLLAIAEDE